MSVQTLKLRYSYCLAYLYKRNVSSELLPDQKCLDLHIYVLTPFLQLSIDVVQKARESQLLAHYASKVTHDLASETSHEQRSLSLEHLANFLTLNEKQSQMRRSTEVG